MTLIQSFSGEEAVPWRLVRPDTVRLTFSPLRLRSGASPPVAQGCFSRPVECEHGVVPCWEALLGRQLQGPKSPGAL